MFDWFYRRIDKIYYGWCMVAIGSAVRIVAGGLHYYGSSIFFLPVGQELGLSRASTSLVFPLARAQGALEGPLAGYSIDRHGPRPVILAAMFFTGQNYSAILWTFVVVLALTSRGVRYSNEAAKSQGHDSWLTHVTVS